MEISSSSQKRKETVKKEELITKGSEAEKETKEEREEKASEIFKYMGIVPLFKAPKKILKNFNLETFVPNYQSFVFSFLWSCLLYIFFQSNKF